MTRVLSPTLLGSKPRRPGWRFAPSRSARSRIERLPAELLRLLPRRPRWLRGPRLSQPVHAPFLRTERLILRPHRRTDAAAWHAIQSEPSVLEYLPWPRRTRRQSYRHLVHRTRHVTLVQADDFLALAVVHDGRLIGDVSLHLRDVAAEVRSAEIGWIVGPEWEGRGYAREAATAMLDLALGELGARQVTAVMDPANTRSIALAERLGFRAVGDDDAGHRVMSVGTEQFRRTAGGTGRPEQPSA